MACGCIKGIYDAHISSTDCSFMVYEDQSVWMEGDTFVKPEKYEVTIESPSFGIKKALFLNTEGRNLITTADLYGKQHGPCFRDDIYCFTAKTCGDSFKISRAYLCNLQCKLDQYTAQVTKEKDWDDVYYLQTVLQGIEINARHGKIQKASELLKIAKDKLRHYTCGGCS